MKIKDRFSIAYILTRYQYNILIATLIELNINKSQVVIIIAKKAQNQGINGKGFYKTLFYDDNNESIKYWLNLRYKIAFLLREIDFYPENIFLRNFNATISRVLLSHYSKANLYLIEEGMPSYVKGNYLGCPLSIKEKLKTLITRFFFSKGLLRLLPVNRDQTIKAGLSGRMKPWLDVPFLPIRLEHLTKKKKIIKTSDNEYNFDVLIIDQPLWQIGISDEENRNIYEHILNLFNKDEKIAIKLHPSSNKKMLQALLDDFGNKDFIQLIDTNENIEELFFSNQLSSIKNFIGFFSWSLCLIYMHKEEDTNVLAFSNEMLDQKAYESYKIMESMGIKIINSKNEYHE